jgi:hypothetical protein
MLPGSAKGAASHASRLARRGAQQPAYKSLARAAYVLRAFLYAYMGYVALRIAITGAVKSADQQASLVAIAGFPLGRILLVGAVVLLFTYALWGFVRAVYDPLDRGDDARGIATRVAFAFSGLAYVALAFFAIGLLSHGGSGNHPDEITQLAGRVLSVPAGIVLALLAGLIAIGAGLGQLFEAYRATFQHDLKRRQMSRREKQLTQVLGQFGFVSRGLVFVLMGWFIVLAALEHNAHEARGFSGVFAYLLVQAYGRPLLGLLALGFIALGLHSLALARYIRLPGERH